MKSYLIQSKAFIGRVESKGGKKGELKMQPSLAMLLKTHIEKMSYFRLLAMLMKTNALSDASRDVYEKTGA